MEILYFRDPLLLRRPPQSHLSVDALLANRTKESKVFLQVEPEVSFISLKNIAQQNVFGRFSFLNHT